MTTMNQNQPGARRRGLALLSAVLLLAVAASAQAVPRVMTDYGDQMAFRSAEINAMGGTGTALYRGGFSALYNPSLLVDEQSVRIDGAFSLEQEHEDRFVPLFDQFDSYVTDAAIASNRYHYWQSGFAIAQRLNTEGNPVTVGVSLTDRYPFQYDFYEEVRNPGFYPVEDRDYVLEERELEVTGVLRDLSVGVGTELHPLLAVGASAHYVFGKRTEVVSLSDNWEEDGSYRTEQEMDLDGVNFTVGVRSKVSPRLELAFAWESQLKAEGETTSESHYADPDTMHQNASVLMSDTYYRYPNRFRGGFTFRPRTDPRTVFTMEMEYIPWHEMADSRYPGYDNPRNLDDTRDVRIGVEHLFYNGMPVRFGFRHVNSYLDREASCSLFTAGVGVPYGSGSFSVSLELGKVITIEEHVFGYDADEFGEAYYADPEARVENTRFRVGVGYNLNF